MKWHAFTARFCKRRYLRDEAINPAGPSEGERRHANQFVLLSPSRERKSASSIRRALLNPAIINNHFCTVLRKIRIEILTRADQEMSRVCGYSGIQVEPVRWRFFFLLENGRNFNSEGCNLKKIWF